MLRLVLFVAGTLALLGFVGLSTYSSARILRTMHLDFNLLLHPAQIGAYLTLAALAFLLGLLSDQSPAQLGWESHAPLIDLALGIGIGLALPAMLNPLLMAAIDRWGPGIYSPAVMRALIPRSRRERLLVPLAMALIVLTEELLFRSLWIGGLSRLVAPWILAVSGALLFGSMHLPQGRLGMLLTGLIGLLFGFLFIWRGSLLPVVTAHYLVNLVQLRQADRNRAWLDAYPDSPAAGASKDR